MSPPSLIIIIHQTTFTFVGYNQDKVSVQIDCNQLKPTSDRLQPTHQLNCNDHQTLTILYASSNASAYASSYARMPERRQLFPGLQLSLNCKPLRTDHPQNVIFLSHSPPYKAKKDQIKATPKLAQNITRFVQNT